MTLRTAASTLILASLCATSAAAAPAATAPADAAAAPAGGDAVTVSAPTEVTAFQRAQAQAAVTALAADIARVAADLPVASAAPMPAPQLEGVGWTSLVTKDLAIVGGDFTTVISKDGTRDEETWSNFVAFNPETGDLIPRFAHEFNGQVRAIELSPDGQTLYVGGLFTRVGEHKRYRIAAIDVATGDVTDWAPVLDYRVAGLAVTNDAVYAVGKFSNASGVARKNAAAFSRETGDVLEWAPEPNAAAAGVAVSPDGSRVVVGGQFRRLGGAQAAGWGAVRADSGRALRWSADNYVVTGSANAGIYDVHGDDDGVYVVGFDFDPRLDFEGTASATWDGRLRWIKGCKGDSYGVDTMDGVAYQVHHNHDCSAVGYLPEKTPRWYQRANASTSAPSSKKNASGRYRWYTAPEDLYWFPEFPNGDVTGLNQGTWSVSSNDGYVLVSGEFPKVNDTARKGIALFGTPAVWGESTAPVSAEPFRPAVTVSGSTARVEYSGVWDRDSRDVYYAVLRNGTVIDKAAVSGNGFWNTRGGQFSVPLEQGRNELLVVAYDAQGNALFSEVVTVTR